MSVWALSDLHLAFGAPNKSMEIFGPGWEDYANKIKQNWQQRIHQEDLILIPGDISWAMKFDHALVDLNWIDALPGTKVILKGNHDYWWPSVSKLKSALPPSIHYIQNNAYHWNDISIGGARLWDSEEYNFNEIIEFRDNPNAREVVFDPKATERIFLRELERLKLSLKALSPEAKIRIALTHYPPIGIDLKSSRVSQILEEYKIDYCIFGHLHNVKTDKKLFGEKNGVKYVFTSGDYLKFIPQKIL